MDREKLINIMEASNLDMSEEDIIRLEKDAGKIIERLNELEKTDTEDVKPLFTVLENHITNRFNVDEVKKNNVNIIDEDKMVDGFLQVPSKEED